MHQSAILKLLLLVHSIVFISSCEEAENKPPYLIGKSGIVTDIEGNSYKTIEIGTQTWMAENLRTSLLNDSTSILANFSHITTVITDTGTFNISSSGYSWYNNVNDTTKNHYGLLYSFYTVESERLCPNGWHVPTTDDWNILINFLGTNKTVGGKLKEAGFNHWKYPNKDATNETGFNAFPGGRRIGSRSRFDDAGTFGYWWTGTSENILSSYAIIMCYDNPSIFKDISPKKDALSVRCIKD